MCITGALKCKEWTITLRRLGKVGGWWWRGRNEATLCSIYIKNEGFNELNHLSLYLSNYWPLWSQGKGQKTRTRRRLHIQKGWFHSHNACTGDLAIQGGIKTCVEVKKVLGTVYPYKESEQIHISFTNDSFLFLQTCIPGFVQVVFSVPWSLLQPNSSKSESSKHVLVSRCQRICCQLQSICNFSYSIPQITLGLISLTDLTFPSSFVNAIFYKNEIGSK